MMSPKPKPDDPAQSKRFIDMAREVEADDPDALDLAFKKIGPQKHPPPKEDSRSSE